MGGAKIQKRRRTRRGRLFVCVAIPVSLRTSRRLWQDPVHMNLFPLHHCSILEFCSFLTLFELQYLKDSKSNKHFQDGLHFPFHLRIRQRGTPRYVGVINLHFFGITTVPVSPLEKNKKEDMLHCVWFPQNRRGEMIRRAHWSLYCLQADGDECREEETWCGHWEQYKNNRVVFAIWIVVIRKRVRNR